MGKSIGKPEITEDGITIVIDNMNGFLYRKDNPLDGYHFNYKESVSGVYHINYCREENHFKVGLNSEGIYFSVQELVKLDPVRTALRYGIDVSELPDSDELLNPFNGAYEKRVNSGLLPNYFVDGKEFFIDVAKREIRSVDDYKERIFLNDLERLSDNQYAVVWRDNRFDCRGDVWNPPEGSKIVVFPRDSVLDPVGLSRNRQYDDSFMLNSAPVVYNRTALVYEASQNLSKIKAKEERVGLHAKPREKYNWGLGY